MITTRDIPEIQRMASELARSPKARKLVGNRSKHTKFGFLCAAINTLCSRRDPPLSAIEDLMKAAIRVYNE